MYTTRVGKSRAEACDLHAAIQTPGKCWSFFKIACDVPVFHHVWNGLVVLTSMRLQNRAQGLPLGRTLGERPPKFLYRAAVIQGRRIPNRAFVLASVPSGREASSSMNLRRPESNGPDFLYAEGVRYHSPVGYREWKEVDKKRGCLESGCGSVMDTESTLQEVIPNEE